MKKIWKYEFPITGEFVLYMPKDHVVLTVQLQRGVPCLWAVVDPDSPKETTGFKISGTGQPLPEDVGRYVGTFMTGDENFVWHLFED